MSWLRLVSPLAFLPVFLGAQHLTELRATQAENDVIVNYKLEGEQGKAYHVSLYSSHNGFGAPLKLVNGDVGDARVHPGTSRTIRWHAAEELNQYDGEISFEIRAVLAAPLFSKVAASRPAVKRGGSTTMSWSGGKTGEQVLIELVGGARRIRLGNHPNTSTFTYQVPKDLKTGKYTIHLTQAGEEVSGGPLAIRPKYPLWMKAAPVVVIGAAVWIVIVLNKEPEFPVPPDLTVDN